MESEGREQIRGTDQGEKHKVDKVRKGLNWLLCTFIN